MGQFGVGQAVRRTEDLRFVTGRGRYTDDFNLAGQAHGVVVRSPHAHAVIRAIDLTTARQAPGVIAIYTGADMEAAGVGHLSCLASVENKGGSAMKLTPRPALTGDRVRFVGDGVAFVVAESVAEARDAAELIDVDYEPLDAAASLKAASAPNAPVVWDHAPGNLCFDWEMGDARAAGEAFEQAAHVTRLEVRNNRLVPNPIEPRAAIGAYDNSGGGGAGRLTLHTSSQSAHGLRQVLANEIFKLPEDRIRVITPDVGGGFGMKGFLYAEQILVLWAARELGRPVKWTGERYEAFQSDNHGRDLISTVELAVDRGHRIMALRVSGAANLGAYLSPYAPFIPTLAVARVLGGVYRVPAIYIEVKGYFSNSVPVDAYRGAGRPEAAYLTERVMDAAARELGLAPDQFRRLNFIPTVAMPYRHPLGFVFDSGDYRRNMTDAMHHADWENFERRRRQARTRGMLRGIGMSCYIESTLGAPFESAGIRFTGDGKVMLEVGTQSNGQGHETTFAQLLHDRLGVPFEAIELVQGDTDLIATGGGSSGSRSLHLQGGAIAAGIEEVVRKGVILAAHELEAAAADIEFENGAFRIVGTDRLVGVMELAERARDPLRLPEGLKDRFENGLDAVGNFEPDAPTFPNGCHICEVETDPDTGVLTIERYTVVDDFGRVINPLVVEGQVHGGVAQGIGQALMEDCVYDEASGQLMTGSFMDYCMPRADDLPFIDFRTNEVPCTTNPLGVKGCGEAGTIGAMPAVVNAVLDALADRGVSDIDAPLTPQRIWQALREASRGRL
ncbi:MAG: xanthine dehydrogenase family protein molybdopterin-binding subunit [Sphingomonadales bacterium]